MPSTKHLLQLVHSLSSGEKTFIRRNLKQSGRESRHGKLFDILDKEVSLKDEAQESGLDPLLLYYRKNKPEQVDSLSEVKHILYHYILKQLRHYQDDKHIGWEVENIRRDARLLRERGLYDQAEKCLQKARKLCVKFELNEQLLPVLREIVSLHAEHSRENMEGPLEKLFYEGMRAIQQLENDLNLERGHYLLFNRYRVHGPARSEEQIRRVKEIRKNARLIYGGLNQTFFQKFMLHSLENLYLSHMGDLQGAVEQQKAIVETWESHPRFQKVYRRAYMVYWYNYLSALIKVKRYKEFEKGLERYSRLKTSNFDERAELQNNVVFLELWYFLNAKEFDRLLGIERKVLDYFQEYDRKVNASARHLLCHNLSLFFWARGELGEECPTPQEQREWNLGKALDWNGEIINDQRDEVRTEIRRLAYLLRAILLYELQALDPAVNLLRSARRQFQSHNCLFDYERVVLRELKRIFESPSPAEAQVHFQDLRDELKEIRKRAEGRRLPGLEEIEIWICSSLENKPFRDCF